jgi:hypothetical protein
MSVMACGRIDCENVLCDTLLRLKSRESYICSECLLELKASRAMWPRSMTIDEIHEAVEEFLTTPKNSVIPLHDDEVEDEFKHIIGED